MDPTLESLAQRLQWLEAANAKAAADMARFAVTLDAVARAVCGDATSAMTQESLIQVQRRHGTEIASTKQALAELEPLRRLYWSVVAIIGIINLPIVMWFLTQWSKANNE